jgi:hypothetical protein
MSTIETLEDPYEALTNIRESLVLSFELSRERHRFTLVCDYPFKRPGARRAFAGFVFEGVRDFVREEGNLPALRGFRDQLHLRSVTGGVVIESVKSTSTADGRHIDLWFGYNFGGVQFRYDSATAYRRNALTREVDGEWLYRDMHSQEEFDFYEPFPDLMSS